MAADGVHSFLLFSMHLPDGFDETENCKSSSIGIDELVLKPSAPLPDGFDETMLLHY